MAIQGTGRTTFTKVEDYSIVFRLNDVRCEILNFDTVKGMEGATFEADFLNGTEPCTVTRAIITCYAGDGSVLGSPIEVNDTSAAVVDGGNLYLSKDCKSIACEAYLGSRKICSSTIAVVRNGESVSVKSVTYKYINNADANANLNWDTAASSATFPTVKPDKGKYMYVMTIVKYTDGSSTNSVSTSYTPTDGTGVTVSTSVTYAVTTDNKQPADISLTSVPSDLKVGDYLWSKTVVTYKGVNTQTTTSIAVSRVGKDGDKGYSLHMLYSTVEKPGANAPISTSMQSGYDYIYVYSDQNPKDDIERGRNQTFKKIKGADGKDAYTYEIYLSASVLKGDSTGKLNSSDSVSVYAHIVKLSGGTATDVTNVNEACFTISRTTDSGNTANFPPQAFTSYTLRAFGTGVKTWNFALYAGGKFLKTVTLPVVRNGASGDGTPATVYTIEPWGSISASGTLKDANTIRVTVKGNVKAYKTTGDKKEEYSSQPQSWRLSIGGTNYDGTATFNNNASNNIISFSLTQDYSISGTVPGSANIALFSDSSHSKQLASLIVPVSLNPGAIQDINAKLGTIQQTTTNMQNTVNGMHGTIETIRQGQGAIELKVQDLQNGGIDTGKPHTSSQVDFRTLDSNSFYPVLIRFKDDGGVRHTVEISRPLDSSYGVPSYATHGGGFSMRLIFSDVANDWGSREGGQLRIESISQEWTGTSDNPICPKIAQYYPFSIMVAWLRGGSKYDVSVDCTDAYISGIWPYMMQVKSDSTLVPDAVLLSPAAWTTGQVNAQGGNPYNLLKHDSGGFYADTENEFLYRFGSMTAGNTFAIVGQPKDSKQWFMATWHIGRVSGSKVYVDISTYSLKWQTQNPLGIHMDDILGYIKKGVSYSKSKWDSEHGFGTSESLDNTAVYANWVVPRPILVIGKESSATNGVYRDRAVLEAVKTCSEGSSVSFYSGTYFDVSPLYGTDGRRNVKPDLLATGIDIKSHRIVATSDNFTVRNNSGDQTFSIDKDGNIAGSGNASFRGKVYASGGEFTGTVTAAKIYGTYINGGSITGTTITGTTITGSAITSTSAGGKSVTKIVGGQLTTGTTNKLIIDTPSNEPGGVLRITQGSDDVVKLGVTDITGKAYADVKGAWKSETIARNVCVGPYLMLGQWIGQGRGEDGNTFAFLSKNFMYVKHVDVEFFNVGGMRMTPVTLTDIDFANHKTPQFRNPL